MTNLITIYKTLFGSKSTEAERIALMKEHGKNLSTCVEMEVVSSKKGADELNTAPATYALYLNEPGHGDLLIASRLTKRHVDQLEALKKAAA